ncbi:Tes106 [Drosophila mojavensis]|uniref:Tes106 n=1 Tax=Drosophila mojavensis TaxID=7230 RepID=B4KEF5_DROMO|nr:Tes106 [Drosophila mojavensis]
MVIMFNPGYIGPNPPCCDTDCTCENNCPNTECGPCPGPNAPCGGCSPAAEKTQMPPNRGYEVPNDNKAEPPMPMSNLRNLEPF